MHPMRTDKTNSLSLLQFFSLLFLVPGIFGLVVSTILSTVQEDQTLTRVEYAALGCFIVGLVFGVMYIEKRSALRAMETEQELMGRA